MHVSPSSGDTHTKFKSTYVGLKPTILGSGNRYFTGSTLSLTFLHSYQFPIFLTLLMFNCCQHGNHFQANVNTNTYTYRGAHNLPYQWGKETIINYTYMALNMSLYGGIPN